MYESMNQTNKYVKNSTVHVYGNNESGTTQLRQPRLLQSHEGEYADDHGDLATPVSFKVYVFAMCAALNSCNLGYDIGVNTGAGPLLQKSLQLTDVQIEVFMGSLNLFAIIGALLAHLVSDRGGRRYAFVVSTYISNILSSNNKVQTKCV